MSFIRLQPSTWTGSHLGRDWRFALLSPGGDCRSAQAICRNVYVLDGFYISSAMVKVKNGPISDICRESRKRNIRNDCFGVF